jgi:nitrogen fixation protein FixH
MARELTGRHVLIITLAAFGTIIAVNLLMAFLAVGTFPEMVLTIRDETGYPAPVKDLQVTVGRPTHMREDQTPEFRYSNGAFRAPLELASGVWNIHLTATAQDGTVFRQRLDQYHGNRVK